ncbi:hypothetical protein DSO57_1022454 [Entomophthora muscae]|uniref:Uncharacterized protein n=1 Tax=Entomophthora muscae TaxID=34485 RepID=A0ACC2SFZ9_9FUNG|nr:hypothetical protein DSO57_1022454 [Entomophthora muscae]
MMIPCTLPIINCARGIKSSMIPTLEAAPSRAMPPARTPLPSKFLHYLEVLGLSYRPSPFEISEGVFTDSFLKAPFKIRVKGLQPFYQASPQLRPTSGISITHIDEAADISELRCFKEGLLLRKSDINEYGTKTHLRAWREFWVVLAGSQLVLFKEVSAMRTRQGMKDSESFPAPRPYSVISLSNAFAVLDCEYTKHINSFRFVASDGRQYLFRASTKHDMMEWISKLNFTAAYKTNDVLPRGLGSHSIKKQNALPRIKSFDFEESGEEGARTKAILSAVSRLEDQIKAAEAKVNDIIHLCRQLKIMIVFSRATRDRASLAIDNLKSQSRRAYLELQRFQCYRDILIQDLEFASY